MTTTMLIWLGLATAGCTSGRYDDLPICGDGFVEGTEECDDGNSVPGDGCSVCAEEKRQQFRWGVATLANPTAIDRCVAGAYVAVVEIEACLNEPCRQQLEAECSAGAASRWVLNQFVWTTQVRIEDAVTREVYGVSPLLRDLPGLERHVIYQDAGTLQLTVDMVHRGNSTNCFDQEIDAVKLVLTPRTSGQPLDVVIPCSGAFDSGAEFFVTPPLSPGVYGVSLIAGGASRTVSDVTIEARHNLFLGTIELEFP